MYVHSYFMEFITPNFESRKGIIMGVYKISFDKKYFYIGSSTNIRKRFRRWVCVFNNPHYIKNKRIKEVISSSNCIEFEILLRFSDENKLRQHEKELIKENSGNKLFLNMVTGLPHPKVKKYKPPSENISHPIRIALFDLKGNLIKEYNSKRELIREHSACRHILINKVLRGEMKFAGGFKFKLISTDGSYLEPTPYKAKELHKKEDFYQIDRNGNIINTFNFTKDVVKAIGAQRGVVNKILRKVGDRKFTRDFTFVYVSEYNATYANGK